MGLFSSKSKQSTNQTNTSSGSSNATVTNATNNNQTQTNVGNTSSQLNAWQPVQGLLGRGVDAMTDYMNSPLANQVYGGPRVAPLSNATRQGIADLQGSQGAGDAYSFFKGVMDSQAGQNNPQIAAIQDMARRQAQASANATFSNAGTTGGTQHQQSFAQGVTDAMAQPLFAAHENDMARKMQAGQMLPGIDQQRIGNQIVAGQLVDQQNQKNVDAARQGWEERRAAPLRAWNEIMPAVNQMGTAYGQQTGNTNNTATMRGDVNTTGTTNTLQNGTSNVSGTTTSKNSPSLGSSILGGAMTALGVASGIPGLGSLGGFFGGGQQQPTTQGWTPWIIPGA